ncbi:hypothetical protein [Anaerosinus massiliensis]|uniref:hypothetical protein n=1 Tax=Massilibacillus massiliensis TaxID=1806837 RepID=UPI000DA62167|nr:hypothetical protein [Massilibacillus massiliensis]
MVNRRFFVDTKKVAKQVLGLGEFMLMQCSSGNLVITGQFILSVSDEQFFSIRCKLELKQLGVWYMKTKDGLEASRREPEQEEWEQRYNEWLNDADANSKLTNTGIEILGCYLFTDGFTYIAVKQARLDMLSNSDNISVAGHMLIVDGVHAIAKVTDNVWKNNDWIRILSGMNLEKETEDER